MDSGAGGPQSMGHKESDMTEWLNTKLPMTSLITGNVFQEFPGGPVVRAQRCHCQVPGFDPW